MKKQFFVVFFGFILMTGNMLSQEYPCNGIRFEENGNYGLKNKTTGKVILPAEYVFVFWSKELAFAQDQNRKYGAVDCNGNVVVPFIYDDVNGVNETNGIRVKTGDKYGLLSPGGKMLLDTIYEGIYSYDSYSESATVFYYGDIGIIKLNGKFGLVKKTGEIIYEPVFEDIGRLHDGYLFAKKEGKWGMMEKNAKILQPFVFDECNQLWNIPGFAFAKKDGYWALLNNQGKELTPYKYDAISEYSFKENCFIVEKDGKKGAINTSGKEICPVQYDGMTPFGHGISRIMVNNKYGYLDKNGNVLLPPEYDILSDPSNSYFTGWNGEIQKDGKFGLADPRTGKVIIPPQYEILYVYDDNYYLEAGIGKKRGLISRKGKVIVPVEYSNVSLPFGDRVRVEKDHICGILDTSGNEICPMIYENMMGFSENLIAAKINGKWGFLDRSGKEKIPFIYDQVYSFSCYDGESGYARVRKDDRWMFIDHDGNTGNAPDQWMKTEPGTYFLKGNYSEGLASVCKCEYRIKNSRNDDPLYNSDEFFNCRQLFIDEKGDEKFMLPYGVFSGKEKEFEFREGFAMVYREQGWRSRWYGFVNTSGELVIPTNYFSAGPFSEGLAYAAKYPDDTTKQGYDIGYINHEGLYAFKLPPKLSWDNYSGCFYHGSEFSDGNAVMYHRENGADCNRYDSIIIDNTGNVIFGLKYNVSGMVKFCDENVPDPKAYNRNFAVWYDENSSYALYVENDGSFRIDAVLPGDLKMTYSDIFGNDRETIIKVIDQDIEGATICTDILDIEEDDLLLKRFLNQQGKLLEVYCDNTENDYSEWIRLEKKGKKISAELYIMEKLSKKAKIDVSEADFLVDFEKMLRKINAKSEWADCLIRNKFVISFDGDELYVTDEYCLHTEGLEKLKEEIFK